MVVRRVITFLVQIALTSLAFAVLFLIYAGITTGRATSHANELCKTVRVGQEANLAQATLLSGSGDFVRGNIASGQIGIGYKGAFAEKWFCNASFADGKVVKVEVRHLD